MVIVALYFWSVWLCIIQELNNQNTLIVLPFHQNILGSKQF